MTVKQQNKDSEKIDLSVGLKHRPTYTQFKENLKNAGPAPVSIPSKAARDKWLSQREKIMVELPTKFAKTDNK